MWMRNEAMRRFIGANRLARAATFGVQNKIQMYLLSGHKHPRILRRLKAAARESHSLLSTEEAFLVHEIAHAQAALPGAMAEFGVYRGASAALIAAVKGDRALHLFDTFEGLPDPTDREEKIFSAGQFKGTLESVRKLLTGVPGVHFHAGLFPDTTAGLEDLRFSFVHLDVDLHDATLAGLEFFYPRMLPGGIILTHDYSIIDGVSRAFSRFLADKPERLIELSTTQAMLVCRGETARASHEAVPTTPALEAA